MSTGIRDQILAAIVTALSGAGSPPGLRVHRSQTTQIEQDVLPATVVYPIEELVETKAMRTAAGTKSGLARRTLTVRLEHRATSSDASVPIDTALDALLSWGTQALVADARLGGLAEDLVEVRSQWAAADKDALYGAAAQDFHVTFATNVADPTRQT